MLLKIVKLKCEKVFKKTSSISVTLSPFGNEVPALVVRLLLPFN